MAKTWLTMTKKERHLVSQWVLDAINGRGDGEVPNTDAVHSLVGDYGLERLDEMLATEGDRRGGSFSEDVSMADVAEMCSRWA